MWIHPGSPHPWLHHCQCTLCKFWLRQELKESQCASVRPVLVCLKLSIFIFLSQVTFLSSLRSLWAYFVRQTEPQILCLVKMMGLAIHNYTDMNPVWRGIIASDPDTSHSLSPYKTTGQSVKPLVRSKYYTLAYNKTKYCLCSDCTAK